MLSMLLSGAGAQWREGCNSQDFVLLRRRKGPKKTRRSFIPSSRTPKEERVRVLA